MRIIDKNKDYYDYLQDSTDTIVFDRRGSFILSKDYICSHIEFIRWRADSKYRNLLVQCGASFWLILVTIVRDNEDIIVDYTLDLVAKWKNYDMPNALLKIDLLKSVEGLKYEYDIREYVLDLEGITVEDIIQQHRTNHLKSERVLSKYTNCKFIKGKKIEETSELPILKESGLASIIEPLDIFCAIEEYFSIEKTKAERTEALGATNNDKIIMHGFDTKVSFRG